MITPGEGVTPEGDASDGGRGDVILGMSPQYFFVLNMYMQRVACGRKNVKMRELLCEWKTIYN